MMEEPVQPPPMKIFIAAAIIPEAEVFLVHHGCIVEARIEGEGFRTTVTLPAGTTRERIAKVASERWCVTLPDGAAFRQIYDPGRGTSALALHITTEEGTDEPAATE